MAWNSRETGPPIRQRLWVFRPIVLSHPAGLMTDRERRAAALAA